MAELLLDKVPGLASALGTELSTWRRAIHAHPELGLQEKETSRLIAGVLADHGVTPSVMAEGSGVIGFVSGVGAPTVALRAELDALPIQEETDVPYRSTVPGIMHACGHDGHIAMLLGASIILQKLAGSLPGSVKLIFQPAEEQSFVGKGGARLLVADGVLNGPPVATIAALHLDPDLQLGTVGLRAGAFMASSTTFEVTVQGRSSHGARPHRGVDAIYVASHVLQAIQGIVARETDALDPKVITVGEIKGGTSPNIVASEVLLRGTIRTLSSEMKRTVRERIGERVIAVARAHGGDATLSFQELYPPVINDSRLVELVREACAKCPWIDTIKELTSPNLGGDDFAFYTEKIPGVLFRLGCEGPAHSSPLHSPTFDFDEKVLPIGAALLAAVALKMLEVS